MIFLQIQGDAAYNASQVANAGDYDEYQMEQYE